MKPEDKIIETLAASCDMALIGPALAKTPDEIRVDAELRQLFRLENGEPA